MAAKSALVLEDSPRVRTMFLDILAALGFRAAPAASVNEAAARVMRAPFDLAIVDLRLTDENRRTGSGLDFIRRVRGALNHPNRGMPIIVVSAAASSSIIAEARDCGADAFLAKPITIALLAGHIARVTQVQRALIESPSFFGPDRRARRGHKGLPEYRGPERRKGGAGDHFI